MRCTSMAAPMIASVSSSLMEMNRLATEAKKHRGPLFHRVLSVCSVSSVANSYYLRPLLRLATARLRRVAQRRGNGRGVHLAETHQSRFDRRAAAAVSAGELIDCPAGVEAAHEALFLLGAPARAGARLRHGPPRRGRCGRGCRPGGRRRARALHGAQGFEERPHRVRMLIGTVGAKLLARGGM